MVVHLEIERRDRRSRHGDAFLRAFAADPDRALSFDDLVRATAQAGSCYSDVVAWIAKALRSEMIEEAGYAADEAGQLRGPRRYRITPAGAARATRDRRRRSE